MKTLEVKSIHVVIDPDGKVWKDSARVSYEQCRDSFVKEWLFRVKNFVDSYTCWQLWGAFEKAGFKIVEIDLNTINA